ncbi:uncharacterized protein BXZ73DRAFT_48397 [Epithele typhae]|uniref:uncharacterized protein n=1 Tax=Epithele typhae TaxID=378194 RepID=UPI0020082E16|nr:uncharacterized protein BXZ73DRAFT_48397 [Epithele typhae]KAH9928484.1 hypothetical protein BXZ73DRAFT_48397 [Epithele typhae]
MLRADDIDLHTGKAKPVGTRLVTYTYGEKMRAAIGHQYAREYKLCTLDQPWAESKTHPGTWTGNPCNSPTVSQYMSSLKRRKVRSGASESTSAKAMDEKTMQKLHDINTNYPVELTLITVPRKRKSDEIDVREPWAGYRIRTMLQCLYIISMLCLLRYDEALHIRFDHIELTKNEDGELVLILNLPFRKTHQTGGILPFVLYRNVEKPWMCPVTAYARWHSIFYDLNYETRGFIFRSRVGTYNEFSDQPTHGLSPQSFLSAFRQNMEEIDINPMPYGTHSFRRGGCQYLALVRRWNIRDVCVWGGWSDYKNNPSTLFRYLSSRMDNTVQRHDFFNPNRMGTDPCPRCRRTCHCA